MTSASHPSGNPPESPDGGDPSMEEILASIRRILNDDDVPAEPPAAPEPPAAEEDDVLVLDETMMVPDAPPDVAAAEPAVHAEEPEPVCFEAAAEAPGMAAPDGFEPDAFERLAEPGSVPPAVQEMAGSTPASAGDPVEQAAPAPELIGAVAAAAAASSVGTLVRTLAAGRATQVYTGGPTLEDMVRAELLPLLKDWLDMHLPPMVERLVRAEIERVVGRFVP
jgi:cell pole-organizing protein PopZ